MNHDSRYDYARYDAGMEGVFFFRASADGAFVKTMDQGLVCYCVMIVAGTVILENDFPDNVTIELKAGDATTLSGLARHRFWTPGTDLSAEPGTFERRSMTDRQPRGSVDLVIGCVPREALALSSLMAGPTIVRANEHPDLSRQLWNAVDMIDAEYASDNSTDRDLVVRRLAEIMEIVLTRRTLLDNSNSGLFYGSAGMHILQAVSAYVRAPHRNWTLTELAREAGMSRTDFAKKFKSITGHTPARIVSRMRLATVAARLTSEPLSIEAAAETAGYSSAAAFVRAFQKEFGETPARWRRNRKDAEWTQAHPAAAPAENHPHPSAILQSDRPAIMRATKPRISSALHKSHFHSKEALA